MPRSGKESETGAGEAGPVGPKLGRLWRLALPLRLYLRHFPVPTGKGLIQRVMRSLLPMEGEFVLRVPNGARVSLEYNETLGWHSLIYGLFEECEISWLCAQSYQTGVVVDVGANVGLFSCALARAPGVKQVWAFEPLPRNVERLTRSLAFNSIKNVDVFTCALGATSGAANLQLATDAAFPSLAAVHKKMGTGDARLVAVEPLDSIWREKGAPDVAAIKIDVEGAEVNVLRGASELIRRCRPIILAEANDAAMFKALQAFLSPYGYTASQPPGFSAWNYVFSPHGADSSARVLPRLEG